MIGGELGSFGTNDIEQIRIILQEAEHHYKLAESELDYCDRKSQDILHEFELMDLKYCERARLGKELTDIRKRRRVAKNTIDNLSPIIRWKQEANGTLQKLNSTIGQMRKIDEKQENCIYYKRADDIGEMIIPHKE